LPFNTADTLLVGGAQLGMDVRICGPKQLWPPDSVVECAKSIAEETGARVTITDDPATGVKGVDFIHTDVWVSMGEDESVWDERIKLLMPYQVNRKLLEMSGNPGVKFMHCLPAFHNTETEVGEHIYKTFGVDAMEVTDEVFESKASIVFDQAENRMHTIKSILVATMA
jgi:ornithine carbamoyltransferase